MKLKKPAMLAALSCLAFAGCAGAASLTQITPKSIIVEFTYPAIPLQMVMTPAADGALKPGNLAADTLLASAQLSTTGGTTARLGFRWAQTPEQTILEGNDGRYVQISGKYNPANKLTVRFWHGEYNSASATINGGDRYWTTGTAVNSVTTNIRANTVAQDVSADRYIMVLEGAVYRS